MTSLDNETKTNGRTNGRTDERTNARTDEQKLEELERTPRSGVLKTHKSSDSTKKILGPFLVFPSPQILIFKVP